MKDVNLGLKLKKWLFIGAIIMLSFIEAAAAAPDYFQEDPNLLKLSNQFYEIAFQRSNGGIVYIFDKQTRRNISGGNRDGILWGAFCNNGVWVSSQNYNAHFKYNWDPAQKRLTLNYQGTVDNPVEVTVNVYPSDERWLKLQATVNNRSKTPVQTFQFPYEMKISSEKIIDALLPMIPGVKLRTGFFQDGKSYNAEYPGVMFADYLALRSIDGKIALYSQKGPLVQPACLGFAHEAALRDTAQIIHNYQIWVENGKSWTSPNVIIRIGQDYQSSITAYRRENGIADFSSLSKKLGARKERFFESPLYKLDLKTAGRSFAELKSAVIDELKIPGIIHPVAFQPNGHDHHYPDFLPPASAYGDNESFADLVKYAQSKQNLVIPYTNFSWWNPDSPTLRNLPAGVNLKSISVNRQDGNPVAETYASDGYVMNLRHEFVARRIAEEQQKMLDLIGFDGIFEDQFGARNAPYDYNQAGLSGFDPSTAYFEGVLAHVRALAKNNLMTECGIDRLAKDEIAFMGTNYLWDLLGYRQETAAYSDYYPLIGMLCRDKVLLYQHDLAIETWTDDKEMFRWNLALGYNFSGTLSDPRNPWIKLIGVFQKYVLSRYADQLVTGFENLGNQVTRTSFAGYKVDANWDLRNSYSRAGHVIAPGGAVVIADDGSVTAGVFTNYNRNILSEGEHYLIEVRSKDEIKVFQPIGTDTVLHIKKYSAWPGVKAAAYGYDNKIITEVEVMSLKDDISFEYTGELLDRQVAYYKLTRSSRPNVRAYPIPSIPELVVTDIIWSPVEPAVGDKVSFLATVRNIGTGPTPEGTILNVAFEIDGKLAFQSDYFKSALPAGGIITLKVTGKENEAFWEATPGPHVISARVDQSNQIPEINENNNTFSKNMPPVDEAFQIAPGIRKSKSAANLALNKPMVSSGATAPAYGENLANDGFVNSYWESINNQFPADLTLDLNAGQSVNKVVLKLPPSWESRIQNISLLGSNDNKQFDPIVDSAGYTFDPATANTVIITFPKINIRYLRLQITGNTGWPAGQVAEFEVYSVNDPGN